MVDVFEDTLNIGAGCPSDVAVNTNTRFQGTVDYHLVNRGDEDGFISDSCYANRFCREQHAVFFKPSTGPCRGRFHR